MSRSELTNPPRRLPKLKLEPAAGGAVVPVAALRGSTVLLLLHDGACPQCSSYIEQLRRARAELGSWDATVVVVTSEVNTGDLPRATSPFRLLIDPDERLQKTLDLAPPALLIADQWGQIHEAVQGDGVHELPGPAAIVEWARYLAIQCPECQAEAL